MKPTTSQRLMRDDGLPAICFLTPEVRGKAWVGRTLTVIPFIATNKTRDETPETAAFRARVEEERRLKSLAGIQRMKNRFAAKAVDYSKMRWDARRAKFVPLTGDKPVTPSAPVVQAFNRSSATPVSREITPTGADNWSRVTKDTARTLAELNGVWDDKYAKLSGGLLVMTVTNRLKGIVKRGGTVRWS